MSDTYFPGRDYPDREEWLARRTTPRKARAGVVVYSGRQPFSVGINAAKRMARQAPYPAGAHAELVKSRHNYRRDR